MSANGPNEKPEYCEFCKFSYYDHIWNDYKCAFKCCAYERVVEEKPGRLQELQDKVSKILKEDNE